MDTNAAATEDVPPPKERLLGLKRATEGLRRDTRARYRDLLALKDRAASLGPGCAAAATELLRQEREQRATARALLREIERALLEADRAFSAFCDAVLGARADPAAFPLLE